MAVKRLAFTAGDARKEGRLEVLLRAQTPHGGERSPPITFPRKLRFPQWQGEYQSALLEPNPALVPARVAAAEALIMKRFRALTNQAEHKEERIAINALNNLRILQRGK